MKVDELAHKYADQGLQAYFVMIANPQGKPPTAIDCKVFAAQKNIRARMLYDPADPPVTEIYGSKETFMITSEAMGIVHKSNHIHLEVLEQEIQKELSITP